MVAKQQIETGEIGMKIIGGTFGVKGGAFVSRDNVLCIEGARKAGYPSNKIQSVQSRIEKERKFHFVTAIIGAIVLGAALSLFFGPFGLLLGLLVAIVGSFHADKRNIVEVAFIDGNSVTLDCTPRGVKKLVRLADT